MFSTRRIGMFIAGTVATISIALAGIGAAASTTTLGFDDLDSGTVGTHMADGYGGFRWNSSDWYHMTDATGTNTFLALGGRSTAIASSDGSDFVFKGLDAFSRRGLDATGSFYFVPYHDGVTVYNGATARNGRQRFTGANTTFVSSYTGPVDGVAIAFTQGRDDWNHFAIDNLQIQTGDAAPAPATSVRLTVKTDGKGSVTASRTGNTFVVGQVITLTASPASGSTWSGWSGDITSSALSITFAVTRDMVVTASFR